MSHVMNGPRPDAEPLDVTLMPLAGRQLIEASAGTGKTWTITALVLRLLLERELDIRQLLVVTFTKAATAELRERIWLRLLEARAALQAETLAADPFLTWLCQRFPAGEGRERALLLLEQARRGFDEAAVYTIHGFCQRVLAESENATGLEEARLESDDHDLLDELVREAWIAAFATLPAMAAAQVADGLTPEIIAGDCRLRLLKPYLQLVEMEPVGVAEVQAAFRQAGESWRQHEEELRAMLSPAVLNGNKYRNLPERLAALAAWLGDEYRPVENGLGEWLRKLSPEALAAGTKKGQAAPAHAFFSLLQTVLDMSAAETVATLHGFRRRLGDEVLGRLAARKERLGRQSFQDMLDALAAALRGEHGEALAGRIREQLPVALIDEFQDTDPIQFGIFDHLYPAPACDLFLVGDPKQAIYSFRGADIHTYLEARNSAGREWGLTVNRRSQQPLITALSALFAAERPFLLEDLGYPAVTAADDGSGVVFGDDRGALHLLRLAPGEDDALLKKGEANRQSAAATAQEVARLLAAAGRGEVSLKGRSLRPGDIALLVPTHRQGAMLAEALAVYGIPAVRQTQDSVWQSAEAGELLTILETLAEPAASGALAAALLTPLLGGTPASVLAMQEDDMAAARCLEQFLAWRERWRGLGFMPMWADLARTFGLTARLAAMPDGERRLTNLRHLVELLQARTASLPGLDAQLEWFRAQLTEAEGEREDHQLRLESDAERVQIVTVHVSKGLQYPVVFCPFLWDGQLLRNDETVRAEFQAPPAMLDLGTPGLEQHLQLAASERLAERLRLLYVALTRAQYRCYLGWGGVEGYESAALTWLLAGGATNLGELQGTLPGIDWQQRLDTLSAGSEACFKWSYLSQEDETLEESRVDAARELHCPVVTRRLHSSWQVGSFTGLSRQETAWHEVPDHDGQTNIVDALLVDMPAGMEAAPLPLADFPAGARSGTCWHAIFEDTPFEKVIPKEFEALVAARLQQFGFDAERWAGPVSEHFGRVLATRLEAGDTAMTLAGLSDYRVEMEFLYPVAGLSPDSLRAAVAGFAMPAPYREALARLDFRQLEGFLKGFIDLIFCHEGRYYVLDYKSNRLASAEAYEPARLPEAMAGHHYYLQYWLYTLALHRYLRSRLPDYDYERHVGGVFYLFLRGMAPGSQRGVYYRKPDLQLVEALDQLFGGQS